MIKERRKAVLKHNFPKAKEFKEVKVNYEEVSEDLDYLCECQNPSLVSDLGEKPYEEVTKPISIVQLVPIHYKISAGICKECNTVYWFWI